MSASGESGVIQYNVRPQPYSAVVGQVGTRPIRHCTDAFHHVLLPKKEQICVGKWCAAAALAIVHRLSSAFHACSRRSRMLGSPHQPRRAGAALVVV